MLSFSFKIAKVNFSAYDQKHEVLLVGLKSEKDVFEHCKSISETSVVHQIEWFINEIKFMQLNNFSLN